jgi:hypothetical protein
MTTNARLVKNVNEHQKLWQLPSGTFVLTSFSNKTLPNETMAFEAWEGGGVKDWQELACAVGPMPKHEEVIEEVMIRRTL